ncbi:hypothetical protein A9Q90_01935 [Gammaproteobacteria bacterium 54_18_T64]|nr:hypothetical protein A9Q90_01935 [Gammaproteobacteria bacterium 54_18_T64]
MDISDYISLLLQLKSTSQTIWGFLLTGCLGAVAFIGSVDAIKLRTHAFLIIVFIGFAVSNHHALDKNFKAREEVAKLVKNCEDYDKHESFIELLTPKDKFWLNQSITARQGNLIFQALMSLLIFIVMGFSALKEHNKSSKRDAVTGAPS